MLESYSRAWIEIDHDAIGHNLDQVQKLVGKTKIMAIVKANAYGHGDIAVAKACQAWGVDFFGVSSVDEALRLRQAGIQENILILGYTPEEHWHYLYEQNITQSLCSYAYACKLNAYAKAHNVIIHAHCKVDTGMNRTGILYQPQEKHLDDIIQAYHLDHIQVDGIFSHFPVSDDLGEDAATFTKRQIALFNEVIDQLKEHGIDPGLTHLQNSYGILNYQDLGYDYCRPGLLPLGLTSDDQIPIASQPDFIPILSLYANVSVVKWIQPGMSVSYGRHFIATKPTKVATMSIGYADGLPRLVSNQGLEVLVHGQRCPLIGNICMDQCMIDVTNVEDVQEGDTVCLIGYQGNEHVTMDAITRKAHTINNELASTLGARVPRLKKT